MYKILLPSLLIFLLALGCTTDEPALDESFIKIYDDSNFDISYNPVDVVETVDGYIVLTGTELNKTDFQGVQLIKLDETGEYVGERSLENYVLPIGDMYLNVEDSTTYFFTMNPTSLEASLIRVSPNLDIVSEVVVGGISYPLAATLNSAGNFLLLSYDPLNQRSVISEVGLAGNLIDGAAYPIGPGSDVEVDLINHYLNASERPLPFLVGETSPGNYYFNGFYNYSFSLVFTDLGDEPDGVLQGQNTNAGVRAVMPQTSGFALAGYQFDENYQLLNAPISTGAISSIADLYPGNMADIKPYPEVQILNYEGDVSATLFASETKSNQILLNFYGADGAILSTEKIGFGNPFTFASIKQTSDQGLIVLGTTFAAGRFERIVLKKYAAGEVNNLIR